ncbi:heme/hemin ABC transporter substrate-binding protein [Vreelandella sp. EE7]
MKRVATWMLGALTALFSLTAAADERWVVLGGDVAETLAQVAPALDVVARDDTVVYPASMAALPSVGYLRRLSAESLLSVKPTHVIANEHAGPQQTLEQLTQAGVEIMLIDAPDTLASIKNKVRDIARHTGQVEAGQALADQIDEELNRLAEQPALPATRAMFILHHSGMTPRAAGNATAAHTALEAIGADNAFATMQGYQSVGAEALVREAPDIVVMSARGLEALGGEAALWQLPGMALTPAGEAERLVVIDDQALLGFGPRTPAHLLALHQAVAEAMNREAAQAAP